MVCEVDLPWLGSTTAVSKIAGGGTARTRNWQAGTFIVQDDIHCKRTRASVVRIHAGVEGVLRIRDATLGLDKVHDLKRTDGGVCTEAVTFGAAKLPTRVQ
jgi:hypothetical protein